MIATRSAVTGREEDLFRELSRCEEWYGRAGRSFAADVEAWLDGRAGEAP
jgi:hypothetical protein